MVAPRINSKRQKEKSKAHSSRPVKTQLQVDFSMKEVVIQQESCSKERLT